MPKEKVSLDVTKLENFIFDMSRCIKCKGCTWVDHIYMPGVKFSTRCPSATRYLFDAYGAWFREQGWQQQAPTEAMVTLPHQLWRKDGAEFLMEIQGLDEQDRTIVWLQLEAVR